MIWAETELCKIDPWSSANNLVESLFADAVAVDLVRAADASVSGGSHSIVVDSALCSGSPSCSIWGRFNLTVSVTSL
jgi:hypothetical protein